MAKAKCKIDQAVWTDTRTACESLRMSRQAWHQWVAKLVLVPKKIHRRRYLWRTADVSRVASARLT